jgi:AcrR family transcriptional regulator
MARPERREVIERAAIELFAERGYAAASIDEIARHSGVSAPVLYDHFASKLDLHGRLLERTRDELLAMWREALAGDAPAQERIPRAIEAWARYVEANPYAARMFFRESTGDPKAVAVHRRVQAESQVSLGEILGGEQEGAPVALEMAAVVMRSGLTGLAVWWLDHPEVTREQIVATAMNTIWIGFERVIRGERWEA